MSDACATVHKLANGLSRHYFPFEETEIPSNGIYILFQKGEKGHGLERIVRIGTHKEERRDIEAKLISTVSWCDGCQPSRRWIGKSSPKPKIVQSGLWQEQKLWNTPLNADDIVRLSKLT